ncbi:MAG: peptidylprolyl isomerase [Oscillospiraceae bacterium]|nr:peptidylprolyl isomerase [Candidatus Equicaccousia limihippi]
MTEIKINIKDYGEITAELYPEKAPQTVENFLSLIKSGFYTGTIFHRVISGFMIQGGGFDIDFNQKPANTIKGEFAANGFTGNDLKHTRGTLSMARTSVPDSASSQFFVMHEDAPHLDGQYAAFGRVTKGIEVVDKIAATPTETVGWYGDVPVSPVVIDSVEIL